MDFSPATYNNTVSALNTALKAAVRWRVVNQVPHHFGLLTREKVRPKFYLFDQFQWLVEAASKTLRRSTSRRVREVPE